MGKITSIQIQRFFTKPFSQFELQSLFFPFPTTHYSLLMPDGLLIESFTNLIWCIPHSLSQILGAEEFGPLQPEDDVEPIPVERNFMISVSHCFSMISLFAIST